MEKALFLAHKAEDPEALPGEGWREVVLPHQWTLEGLEAEVGWYRLELPALGPRCFLRSWGDYYQEAWLDGVHLGGMRGTSSPGFWSFLKGGSSS